MICPKCGAPLETGYRFITCNGCGSTFDSFNITKEPSKDPDIRGKDFESTDIKGEDKQPKTIKIVKSNTIDETDLEKESKVIGSEEKNENTGPEKAIDEIVPEKESEEKQMNNDYKPENTNNGSEHNNAPTNVTKKQFYNEWWFWLIVAALVIGLFFMFRGGKTQSSPAKNADSTNVENVVSATNTTTSPAEVIDSNEVIKQLEVQQYSYANKYDNGVVLVIKNNSKYTLDLDMTTTFYASNNMVGTDEDYVYDVPSGHQIAVEFSNEDKYDRFEYLITPKLTEDHKPVVQNVAIENQNISGDKVVFTIKNNGDLAVDDGDVIALFFKGDTLVDTDNVYFYDLAPGQSINKEANSWTTDGDFDKALLYVSGQSEYMSE